MITKLNKLDYEFKKRHDFNTEQFLLLKNKYPEVDISEIPDAWIILIDKLLSRTNIKKVTQRYGLLIVDKECKFSQLIEEKLYEIDKDLHEEISYG